MLTDTLLEKLGYSLDNGGVYHHKERKAVFLGDFVDGGNAQARVINIVKPMVENGFALAVTGNHEFNAICYHTNHPETGKPLREHSNKNTNHHVAFLDEFPLKDKKTLQVIDWLKTLPVFIELDEFRAIHACWNQDNFDFIKPLLNSDNTLSDEMYVIASEEGTKEFDAVEVLLKGLEIPLPEGFHFFDGKKNKRTDIRIKWWEKGAKTYREYAQVPEDQYHNIPDMELADDVPNPEYPDAHKPVFVEHYWFRGDPKILKNNVACLDYSVAGNRKLVCYRWNSGDTVLNNENFIQVEFVANNDSSNR